MTRKELKDWYEINEYVYLDFETTGFSYRSGDKIIEIAAYKVQNDTVVDKFVTLVNPQMPIPDNITEITQINDNMVKWKDPIEVIMPKFYQFFGSLPLIAHNARFDIDAFLKPMLKDMYSYELPNTILCTLRASKVLAKNSKSHKLHDVYKFCTGKESNTLHRAEADVAMGVEVAKAIQKFIKENYEAIYNCLSK